MSPDQENQQIYLGYFATILPALMVAVTVASWIAPLMAAPVADADGNALYQLLSAGFFLALCVANPVGYVIRPRRLAFLPMRLVAGFGLGAALHVLLIAPFVGEGLARIVMILIAALGVPVMIARDRLGGWLASRGAGSAVDISDLVLRIARWPDRFLFVLVMAVSFSLFARFATELTQTLTGLGGAVLAMTAIVAFRSAAEAGTGPVDGKHDDWLHLVPEDEPVLSDKHAEAWTELRQVALSLGPGAVAFGGMTWLAVQLMPFVRSELLTAGSSGAEILLRDGWQVAVIGLGLVVAGSAVLAAVGIGLLQVIGHYARWTPERRRFSTLAMLRSMAFRPLSRA